VNGLHPRGPAELPRAARLVDRGGSGCVLLEEFVAAFDIVDVNPNPARFDQKKAESINGDHIRMLDAEDFADRLVPYLHAAGLIENPPTAVQQATLDAAAPLVQERMQLLGEAPGLLGFLFRDDASPTRTMR
jgi:glutamyl-tRNA synthetase